MRSCDEDRVRRRRLRVRAQLVAVLAGFAAVPLTAAECVEPGRWYVPAGESFRPAAPAEALRPLADRQVVLLGEQHDRADHHRWQLQTLAALQAQKPGLVIGFEMFPRRVQPALDAWVAGELTEPEFLQRSDWNNVWGFDAGLYLPLFHFARLNRLPMVALNVDRALLRAVSARGWDGTDESVREGVTRPAAPLESYERELFEVFRQHPGPDAAAAGRDDPRFRRFVESQQTWDRAMAEAIAAALRRHPGRQAVAIMGRGHTGRGGVPHQLADLGVGGIAVLLPWERGGDCAGLRPGVADAVFGVEAPRADARARARLGVSLAPAEAGVRIDAVESGSIASAAGMRRGDLLLEIAGERVRSASDVQRAVGRQPPGTWLPLRVRRDGGEVELIAKFPPE